METKNLKEESLNKEEIKTKLSAQELMSLQKYTKNLERLIERHSLKTPGTLENMYQEVVEKRSNLSSRDRQQLVALYNLIQQNNE